MSKEYSSDVNDQNFPKISKTKKTPQSNNKASLDPLSATGFSSDQEKEYIGRLQKLTNVITKVLTAPSDENQTKSKFSDLKDRGLWTIIMMMGFFLFIYAGNFYCALLVVIIIACIFNELKDLTKYEKRNEIIKNFQFINW